MRTIKLASEMPQKGRAPVEWSLEPRKSGDDYTVGAVYPSTYNLGMSNLGFLWLVRNTERENGFACERFFLDGGAGVPASVESGRVPGDCHVLAFSVSMEADYVGILRFLRRSGLPLYSRERTSKHPFTVVGGAAVQVNPEPLAPFLDLVLPGEGEAVWGRFLKAYAEAPSREDLLERLAGSPQVYVPGWFDVRYGADGGIVRVDKTPRTPGSAVCPIRAPRLSAASFASLEPPHSHIFTTGSEFPRTLLVEVGRGCPMGCRYCWAGFHFRPMRSFPAEAILAIAEKARTIVEKVGIVSTAVCQHPGIVGLLERLRGMGYSIGVSSLRVPDITDDVLRLLADGGEDSVTLAPETGGGTLLRRANKRFGVAEVLEAYGRVLAAGIRKARVYLMVGLPGETRDDLDDTVGMVKQLRRLLLGAQAGWTAPGRITVSVSPFVPKPRTPFQFALMDDPAALKRKIRHVQSELSCCPEVRVSAGSVREAVLEWRLSMANRGAAAHLEALADGRATAAGFCLDAPGWRPAPPPSPSNPPPWSTVDDGLAEAYLRSEWVRSLEEAVSAPCPGVAGCDACGVCPPPPAGGGPPGSETSQNLQKNRGERLG